MTSPLSSASAKKSSYVDPAGFTPHFSWKPSRGGEAVQAEGVALARVAAECGTPTYLYSSAAIAGAYRELDRGLADVPHTLCFAVKANGNLALLRMLARMGSGFDAVSGGEIELLRRAGVPGNRIVFSGVGKTREEMREALRYPAAGRGARRGILLFNVESEAELEVLLEEAARSVRGGNDAPGVSVRVNPDVQAGGHPHISTGHHQHKFGLDWPAARRLYLAHRESRVIQWQGISAHIGSQVLSLDPFREALRRLAGYFLELRRAGVELRFLDFGGGLGVRYTGEKPPSRAAYARLVRGIVRPLGCHLLLEPGRSVVAQAGVLLTRVIYTKENRGKRFVIVDAAMNDLMRPVLYGAVHPVTPVTRGKGSRSGPLRRADIVGPVCESGDCFLRDWPLPPVEPGDVLAIWCAGAYGMSLASNYNARRRPAEVLVAGRGYRLIRRRETLDDLLRAETGVLAKSPR
ncbi:MAG: diaminopimelate decarboxylase [Acidobacteriia bacterium]|nr:diaminopimelate decarboxylase [Terriglobia bacterium]